MNPEDSQVTPGVEEPATPPAQSAEPTPGETPVTTPEPEKQYVPLERFQEVNNSLKELKEWKESQEAANQPEEPEPLEIDPDTQKLLDTYLASKGVVTKEQITQQEVARQQQQDLLDVKTEFNLTDDQIKELASEADAAGAKNKQGLRNAYFARNLDSIVDARVKEALEKAGSPDTFTERPSGAGAQAPAPEGAKLSNKMSPQERLKARISAARTK